jgi:hypothetical protein
MSSRVPNYLHTDQKAAFSRGRGQSCDKAAGICNKAHIFLVKLQSVAHTVFCLYTNLCSGEILIPQYKRVLEFIFCFVYHPPYNNVTIKTV